MFSNDGLSIRNNMVPSNHLIRLQTRHATRQHLFTITNVLPNPSMSLDNVATRSTALIYIFSAPFSRAICSLFEQDKLAVNSTENEFGARCALRSRAHDAMFGLNFRLVKQAALITPFKVSLSTFVAPGFLLFPQDIHLRHQPLKMTVTLNFDELTTNSSTRRTLSDISLSVAKSKKIVVVTGAGISCSCGIPVST